MVRIKHYLNVLLFLEMLSHLGKGLPVTPSLTTGLAATLSSPPMLFVAEHLYNDDVHDGDIYIMMKCLSVCLSVTKNDHFLLGVSCNHLNPP